tara:strand:+ start:998 stop:1438 length:441 start_codon:yes stop_codon:yes gene_type:complete
MLRTLCLNILFLFVSCNQKANEKICNTFLQCLDGTVWKITTGTFEQYNVFHNSPNGIFMSQYEMFNKSFSCKEFSFSIKELIQTPLEMKGKFLNGDIRFVWNINELYCSYKEDKKTENITFYKSSVKELQESLKLKKGCIFPEYLN